LFAALIHEIGHAVCIKFLGGKIKSIIAEPFGAIIEYGSERLSYGDEVKISLFGIFFNLIGGFLGSLVFCFFVDTYVLLFVFACLFFAVINAIPIHGSDGSNALYYCLIKNKTPDEAEHVVKYVSVASRIFFASIGILLLFLTNFNNSLFALLLFAVIPR
ncbi:MAG: hypothetical protein RR246_00430, partial [Clostridia bacterium]